MKTIHKYPLPAQNGDCVSVRMPLGARPIHVGMQNNALCVWALVDTERQLHPHVFYIRGTGQDCDIPSSEGEHPSSLQLAVSSSLIGGEPTQIVIHIFFAGPDDRLIPVDAKKKTVMLDS